ncbi:MAG: glycosyltransferase [Gaiellaceae bacterium]
MRILIVSQMYPGPEDPDLGVFVQDLERALAERGHEMARAVLDRRGGGKLRYLSLAREARAQARRFRPDVVYAHFLVPSGLIAALASRAPLVVTAHGRDVRNVGSIPGIAWLTRRTLSRAAAVVAVSAYLGRELEQKLPGVRSKLEIVDCGVDLERFQPRDQSAARVELGWSGETPLFVCVGSLSERKNVMALARAFGRLARGSLVCVGDGPLRRALERLQGVTVTGRIPHQRVERWLCAADVVCQPSLIEPFGQALLEALACGRPVLATRLGGPPEFVPPESGVLVDPSDEDALLEGLASAVELPCPNAAARAAAEAHGLSLQAERIEAILERAVRARSA